MAEQFPKEIDLVVYAEEPKPECKYERIQWVDLNTGEPKLNEFKLNLCSGWYGANLRTNSVNEEKNLIQDQLKLFKDCNSPCMVFAEVSGSIQGDPNRKLSTRPQMDLEESKKYYEKISEMGKYLASNWYSIGSSTVRILRCFELSKVKPA